MMCRHLKTILQYFISTVYNTVSLAQLIICGPVRDIIGITFALGSLCGRTSLPINDLSPCTYPHHMGGRGGGENYHSRVNALLKTLFPMCCVVFNKTNVILSHLLASLFLQFEKFYVKLSVCFCLISVLSFRV